MLMVSMFLTEPTWAAEPPFTKMFKRRYRRRRRSRPRYSGCWHAAVGLLDYRRWCRCRRCPWSCRCRVVSTKVLPWWSRRRTARCWPGQPSRCRRWWSLAVPGGGGGVVDRQVAGGALQAGQDGGQLQDDQAAVGRRRDRSGSRPGRLPGRRWAAGPCCPWPGRPRRCSGQRSWPRRPGEVGEAVGGIILGGGQLVLEDGIGRGFVVERTVQGDDRCCGAEDLLTCNVPLKIKGSGTSKQVEALFAMFWQNEAPALLLQVCLLIITHAISRCDKAATQ